MALNPHKFGFECSSSGQFQVSAVLATSVLRVDRYSGITSKTFTTTLELADGVGSMLVLDSGVALYAYPSSGRWQVLPPQTLAYLGGPRKLHLRIARGRHEGMLLSWSHHAQPLLTHFLEREFRPFQSGQRELIARGTYPHFASALDRLRQALATPSPASAVAVMSVVYEGMVFLSDAASTVSLAPSPANLPAPIQALVDEVRREPDRPWPLKQAADHVGYSPFHFSRMFKQLSGFGFHEFVDRTRTERAVEELCATDDPVDLVAANAGFGTTQGLRESIKEYLGLVPSDLRSTPGDLD